MSSNPQPTRCVHKWDGGWGGGRDAFGIFRLTYQPTCRKCGATQLVTPRAEVPRV